MEIRFPLILDGATGTELQKRGYGGDVSAEQWTLEHPDVIVGIQRGYVAAGSQVLYTPTFGANRQKLEERSIFNQTADYNRRLAALSREAAGGKAWIAGDLAPTGLFLAPLGEASFEDLVDIYTEQAAGLEAAGVDLYVIETMMTLSDARAAVLAVRSVSDKPIFVSFTCDESGRSLSGTDVTAALTVLQGMGISAFGLNCSTGPEQMLVQLRRLREYARVPLIPTPVCPSPSAARPYMTARRRNSRRSCSRCWKPAWPFSAAAAARRRSILPRCTRPSRTRNSSRPRRSTRICSRPRPRSSPATCRRTPGTVRC